MAAAAAGPLAPPYPPAWWPRGGRGASAADAAAARPPAPPPLRGRGAPRLVAALGGCGGVVVARQSPSLRRRGGRRRRAGAARRAQAQGEGDAVTALVAWLAEAGAEGLEGVRVAPSRTPGAGLGLLAARRFEPGELVCTVPGTALLCSGPQREGVPQEVALAEALLGELHLGSASQFAPYLRLLPDWEALAEGHPLHWPPGVCLEELFAGSVHGRMLAAEFLRNGRSHAEALVASGAAASLAEAKWAVVIVDSRTFTFRAGKPDMELALVPLLDLVNSFCLMDDGQPLWQCSFEPEGPVSAGGVIVAERPVEEGAEILHLYEANSTARLWMTYGFVPPAGGENPFEAAAVEVHLAAELEGEDSAMRSAKLAALARAGFGLDAPVVLELPSDAEVEGNMLPVARILACQGAEEVEALMSRSWLPGDDGGWQVYNSGVQLEARARAVVARWAADAIRVSDAAAGRLREVAAPGGGCSEPGVISADRLRTMALELLRRERQVLELELASSERFIADAPRPGASSEEIGRFTEEHWDAETGWLGAG